MVRFLFLRGGAALGRFLLFAVLGGAPAGARAAPGSCARWEPEQPVGARARGAMPGSPSAAGRPIGPASLFNEGPALRRAGTSRCSETPRIRGDGPLECVGSKIL